MIQIWGQKKSFNTIIYINMHSFFSKVNRLLRIILYLNSFMCVCVWGGGGILGIPFYFSEWIETFQKAKVLNYTLHYKERWNNLKKELVLYVGLKLCWGRQGRTMFSLDFLKSLNSCLSHTEFCRESALFLHTICIFQPQSQMCKWSEKV